MFRFMSSAYLYAYTCLSFWNHRIKEPDHIYAFLQKGIGKFGRKHGIVKHDGNDSMGARLDIKSCFGDPGAEILHIAFQLIPERGGFAQQVKYCYGSAYN